jgi:glycosyltransferase involved in cell wall biosynthesis
MRVFLNLVAGTAGGQLTRARAFLDRFHHYAPSIQLVVAKEQSVLTEYATTEKRLVVDVRIGSGRFKAVNRVWWENTAMSQLAFDYSTDVFLTFSHYLPRWSFSRFPSVVGVSNLAPFSNHAWTDESLLARLRLIALRRTILSSAIRATRVIALSNYCRDVLVANGVPGGKIMVAQNGVDAHWGQVVGANEKLFSRFNVNRPYLLYVSHIYRYKNFGRLIEAFGRLSPEVRGNHQLVLVGKPFDQDCYQEMLSTIARLGLMKDIIIIQGLSGDELKMFYQQAKLFVFPSLIENSPNILLEAMASGVPVISGNLAPMPEFCGNAAEYCNPLDINEMAKIMELLLMSPSRLADLKVKAMLQARNFSWDNFVRGVVDCLGTIDSRH